MQDTKEPPWPRPWLAIHERLGLIPPAFDDRPLGAHVERHAAERGKRSALLFAGHEISYAALDSLSGRLAAALEAEGIGRGDVVGIHLPNLPQYAIALTAISKLGAIGSGVSPLLAPRELEHQLKDCSAKAVITLDALAPALAAMPDMPDTLKLVLVTGPADALMPSSPALPEALGKRAVSWSALLSDTEESLHQRPVKPRDTFMVQYTGGTTGRPKGAELSHRTLMHNPLQYGGATDMREGEEVMATAFPFFHIAGLTLVLNTLLHGAAVYLIPNPRDVKGFAEAMQQRPPTMLSAVPALYDMLLAEPAFHEIDFSSLKMAATGAAPMPQKTAQRLAAVIGEGKLADLFGMTETGPCYTFHPPEVRKEGAVGLPMPGAEVRILDVETGTKDMPFGEPGEICASGPQLMKGYLNMPEETAKALREHDGRMWMHSGDVGFMDEEGYITLCDRAKDMLIVGGYKVFSVEVEDKVGGLPVIDACAVIGTPDEARPGNDVVNLFIALSAEGKAKGEDAAMAEILSFMRETMAPFKVPKKIHVVEAIPLTPVGKIDKKVLRAQAVGD